ncbi:MAG: HypC/HybG/HupF family hydrogenase formation chaperone [Bacteroidales bacterium]
MCLAVPGKVISINTYNGFKIAVVDFDGLEKQICISWIDDISYGEYILAHSGVALCKIEKTEAEETINDLRKICNNIL